MGGLTPAQEAEFKEAFVIYDKEKKGFLTTAMTGTLMRSLGQNPTDNELKEIFASLGVDPKEGKLDLNGVMQAVTYLFDRNFAEN